jgi:hypothetical protein
MGVLPARAYAGEVSAGDGAKGPWREVKGRDGVAGGVESMWRGLVVMGRAVRKVRVGGRRSDKGTAKKCRKRVPLVIVGEIERRDNIGPVRKVGEVGMANTVHGCVVVRRREVRAVAEGKTDISCSWLLNPTPQFSFKNRR